MARATIKFRLEPGQCRTIAGTRVCNRWTSRTAGATEDYVRGVKNPKRRWGRETCKACDRYKEGVDRGHTRGAFKKGVIGAGGTKWSMRSRTKGPHRWAEGVHMGGEDYGRGYKPYHSSFPSIFLPKRFPRGDPRNISRCAAVCTTFGRIKVGKGRAGETVCPED